MMRCASARFAASLGAALFAFAPPARACAVCGEALSGAAAMVREGYFWGIVVFLALPALLVAGTAFLIAREVRRARRAKPPAAADAETVRP